MRLRNLQWSKAVRATRSDLLVAASGADALRRALADIDTHVPLRSEGRETSHVERYDIVHLLATLPDDRWAYPLTVHHCDRPDFLITDGEGRRTSVECVEAVSENQAKKSFLRERGFGAEVHFIEHARPGEKRRSTKRLLKELEENYADSGWIGDSAEREWADVVSYFGLEKSTSVKKDGYDRGDEGWLLVYFNWPLPHIDPELAARYLIAHPTFCEIIDTFSRVFVMSDKWMWEFYAGKWDYCRLLHGGGK